MKKQFLSLLLLSLTNLQGSAVKELPPAEFYHIVKVSPNMLGVTCYDSSRPVVVSKQKDSPYITLYCEGPEK